MSLHAEGMIGEVVVGHRHWSAEKVYDAGVIVECIRNSSVVMISNKHRNTVALTKSTVRLANAGEIIQFHLERARLRETVCE